MAIRISIVEDDHNIRTYLSTLINGSDGYTCVSTHESSEDAIEKVPEVNPDVILMDINLPAMSGIECVKILKELMHDTQIIMLTVYEDGDRIFESLKAGASGYLLKRTSPAELLQAIYDVYNGGSPMSSQIARKVVQSFHKAKLSEENLTKREEEILDLLSQGFRYKEIAERLFISPDTVHTHVRKIYEKLQVRSRTEAVVKYLNH